MSAGLLAIGEVAASAGTTVTTVRYYDDIGIINASARVGGKRRFDPATVERIGFIRRAKDVGFSLDEIRVMLDEETTDWRRLVDGKLVALSERRRRLDAMIALLEHVRDCSCDVISECPRLEL